MFRKKLTAIMTAAIMTMTAVCGGTVSQAAEEEPDSTVYITVEPASGMAGSSVPVTVDIQSDYYIWIAGVSLTYDSSLTPVPADPDEPNVPKAEVDLRASTYDEPEENLFALSVKPEKSEVVIGSTEDIFRHGRVTVWFDIPADAAAGTQYPLSLRVNSLWGKRSLNVGQPQQLPSSLKDGSITVTDQPAVTTTAPPVEAKFDITPEHLDLTDKGADSLWGGYTYYQIPYTASENLDYIEWKSENDLIYVDKEGKIHDFSFSPDDDYALGMVTATAYFLDGTVLTDTVTVYARNTKVFITGTDIVGPAVIVDWVTNPLTTTTTAKAATTTARAATTTAKVATTTAKAATTTARATTTTARATTTTAKAATTTARAATTTAKAATTTAKATTTTARATTTTARATTTTARATTTTARAITTTAKVATTTAKAATTTAKAATTTAKAATTTARATTTTARATTTTAKAATTTAKVTTTTAKVATTTVKAATTTAKAATTTAAAMTTVPVQTTTAAPPEPEILKGDVNDDGEVGVEDAQMTLKAYTKRIAGLDMELTERQIKAANVNDDGELSVDDAQFILRYYTLKQVAGMDVTWEELFSKQKKPFRKLGRSA